MLTPELEIFLSTPPKTTEIDMTKPDAPKKLLELLSNNIGSGTVDIVWGPCLDIRWETTRGVWTTSDKQIEVESTLSNKTKSSIDSFNEYFRKNKAIGGIVAGSGVLRWYNPSAEVKFSDNEMSQGSHIKQCGCTTEQLMKQGCTCGGI